MDTLKQYSDYLWNYDVGTYLQNPWILGLLTLILIVYGSLAQQELPNFMYVLFDNWFFRLIMFVLIIQENTKVYLYNMLRDVFPNEYIF